MSRNFRAGSGGELSAFTHAVILENGRTFLDVWPFDIATQHGITLRFLHGDVVSPGSFTKRHSSMVKNPRQSSPKVASQASKILRDPKSTKAEKSVAASDLSQASGKKKK